MGGIEFCNVSSYHAIRGTIRRAETGFPLNFKGPGWKRPLEDIRLLASQVTWESKSTPHSVRISKAHSEQTTGLPSAWAFLLKQSRWRSTPQPSQNLRTQTEHTDTMMA